VGRNVRSRCSIETERLQLRPVELGDLDEFAALLGDPVVVYSLNRA
jgi:hypothetical protein